PISGPGRSIYGTAALTELKVEAAPADDLKKVQKIKFVKATADFNPPEKVLDKSMMTRAANAVSPDRSTMPSTARMRRPGEPMPDRAAAISHERLCSTRTSRFPFPREHS